MTTEEKLDKAIEFIKQIEKLDFEKTTADGIISSASLYCDECGEYCNPEIYGPKETFVKASYIDKLKDKAWHLLADISE